MQGLHHHLNCIGGGSPHCHRCSVQSLISSPLCDFTLTSPSLILYNSCRLHELIEFLKRTGEKFSCHILHIWLSFALPIPGCVTSAVYCTMKCAARLLPRWSMNPVIGCAEQPALMCFGAPSHSSACFEKNCCFGVRESPGRGRGREAGALMNETLTVENVVGFFASLGVGQIHSHTLTSTHSFCICLRFGSEGSLAGVLGSGDL